ERGAKANDRSPGMGRNGFGHVRMTPDPADAVRGKGPPRCAVSAPSPEAAVSYFVPPAACGGGGTSQAGGGGNAIVAPTSLPRGGIRSRFLCVTGGRLFRYDAMATASSWSRMDE